MRKRRRLKRSYARKGRRKATQTKRGISTNFNCDDDDNGDCDDCDDVDGDGEDKPGGEGESSVRAI